MKLAVISDIHSDLPSLEKALAEIQQAGFDRIVCLGDIVGYSYHYSDYIDGRDPNACVDLVRGHCDDVICGNHDLHAIRKLPSNYKELGMSSDWYSIDLGERDRISGGDIWLYDDDIDGPVSKESADYLRKLPESLVIKDKRFSIFASHFIWPDITGSRKSSPSELKDFREHLELVKRNSCMVGLAGHAHPEGYAQITKKAFGMNYFRKAELIRRSQVIVVPAITRRKGRSGFLVLDTEKKIFEAIALD